MLGVIDEPLNFRTCCVLRPLRRVCWNKTTAKKTAVRKRATQVILRQQKGPRTDSDPTIELLCIVVAGSGVRVCYHVDRT